MIRQRRYAVTTARKRPRVEESKPSYKACVICDEKAPVTALTKPRDIESWTILLKAAEIQKFASILFYKDVKDVPDVSYHLECSKTFVHKKRLQRIEKQEAGPSSSHEYAHEPRTSREKGRASLSGRVYGEVCIFCEGTKYQKGSHSRERLYKAVELRCDRTLKTSA